jgi:hypothetical protein
MIQTRKAKLINKFGSASSKNKNRVHIVPSDTGWSVKREGALRSSAIRSTKEIAIKYAKKLNYAELIVVHKKDGTIQEYTN